MREEMGIIEDAMNDLLREVEAGSDYESALSEIANEYELNPKLLSRKFIEKHGSQESALEKANATRTSRKETEIDYELAEKFVKLECLRAGVRSNQFFPIRGKRQITIKHKFIDCKSYRLILDLHARTAEWQFVSDLRDLWK